MPKNGRKQPQGLSPAIAAATVMTGGVLAFGVCGLGLAMCAGLVLAGRMDGEAVMNCCWVCCAAGSFAGGLYSALCCKSRMLAAAMGAALVQLILWCVIGLGSCGRISLSSLGAFFAAAGLAGGAAGLLSLRLHG